MAQKKNKKPEININNAGDFDGFDRGYGSSPSENTRNINAEEDTKMEITSEEQRYLKFQKQFNLKQFGGQGSISNRASTLLTKGGNTPKQM